jgi:hypothetical protein
MPGPGSESIGKEERDAVLEVVESGRLFRYGQLEDRAFKRKGLTFEQELAAACSMYTGCSGASAQQESSLLFALEGPWGYTTTWARPCIPPRVSGVSHGRAASVGRVEQA